MTPATPPPLLIFSTCKVFSLFCGNSHIGYSFAIFIMSFQIRMEKSFFKNTAIPSYEDLKHYYALLSVLL